MESQNTQVVLMQFVNKMSAIMQIDEAAKAFRRQWIVSELEDHNWNQCATARAMGWHRNTLTRNMAQLGIPPQKRYKAIPVTGTNVIFGV